MKSAPARIFACVFCALALAAAAAQSVTTTTVQGTVYNAGGAPISGTVQIAWPAFTTAASQAIAAGSLTVSIGVDGFLSVNLAPNQGASPAGLYYTATYYLADGSTSTEYWTVPAAAQAALASVRAQVMPAAQAVQAVNKAYVDQAIQQATSTQVSSFGGTLTGPLYLNGDPTAPTQAADKHYVDTSFGQSLSVGGGAAQGPLTATQLGAAWQADQLAGADFGAKLQTCINALSATYGGVCDARNFAGALTISTPLIIATGNVSIQFPCATIATANPIVIAAGTRNVTLHGCATRGTSSASGSQGGTVFLYSGSAAFFQVGDSTYAADTLGFHLDNVVVNTTPATAATAQALAAWRTQEMNLDSLYLLGNANQTALTLDGTGNYTGGTFSDVEIDGFQTAVNAIGHQVANAATTDWLNASTFLRLHIDCPTSNGNPIAGTTGINLLQGDGNTFTGGDVESCATALHLGPNAQNNTLVGLRNENSTAQVVADSGSSYNNWITGGTMFTGKLTDNGTRNSFLDTFHRSFNALNGDWYGSQQDATLTNHLRLGIGSGNERGLLNRYQTDYGYRWTTGFSDATAGEQFYQVLDELNNVYRISIGQYNNGQSSTNNQTVLNSAGSGAIVLNGSSNAGTGGLVLGSGGATSSTVATIDKSGNAQFNGTLLVGGAAQSTGTLTVRNNADAEVDYYLWPGLTASQKGSFTYKDWNGNSQWFLVKDTSNNWALNSAIGGLDSFKAYQSTNSGDTYINASNSSGVVRVNYETGAGSAFNIYGGNASTLYASFTGATSIKFPGLAASSGHNCMQVDNSGYLSNLGQPCQPAIAGIASDGNSGLAVQGAVTAGGPVATPQLDNYIYASQYATGGNGTPSNPYTSPSGTGGIQEAINAAPVTTGNAASRTVYIPSGYYLITGTVTITTPVNILGAGWDSVLYVSSALSSSTDVLHLAPTSSAEIKGFRLSDFAIEPQSGTPGRCGINLDGTSNVLLWGEIDHLNILQLGSNAICASGSGAAQGTPVLTRIEESSLDGGISCTNCGDSVTIRHNQLTGAGSNNIDLTNGATGFVFEENNVTIAGGTHFGGSNQITAPKILNNEFETEVGFTGSNGAVLDLDGPVVGGLIAGNSFAVVNSITANGLRLNNATGVTVKGNYFERGAGSSNDILATSSSAHDNVLDNYWFNGLPFTSMFNNSGAGNWFLTPYGSNGFVLGNNMQIAAATSSGSIQNLLYLDANNATNLVGYDGSSLLYSGNGPVYMGSGGYNGERAAAFGPYIVGQQPSQVPQSGTYESVYNFALVQLLMSRTAPTIGSGFGTSPSIAANNGTAAFTVNVGSGGTASSGVLSLPTAATEWKCTCEDKTTLSSTVFTTRQTGWSSSSCTVGNFNTSAAAAPWAANDVLSCSAVAY